MEHAKAGILRGCRAYSGSQRRVAGSDESLRTVAVMQALGRWCRDPGASGRTLARRRLRLQTNLYQCDDKQDFQSDGTGGSNPLRSSNEAPRTVGQAQPRIEGIDKLPRIFGGVENLLQGALRHLAERPLP